MTKRKMTEYELINPSSEVNAEGKTTDLIAQPGMDVEGPREEPTTVARLVPEGEVKELAPEAVTELADVEGLTNCGNCSRVRANWDGQEAGY